MYLLKWEFEWIECNKAILQRRVKSWNHTSFTIISTNDTYINVRGQLKKAPKRLSPAIKFKKHCEKNKGQTV